MYRKYWFIGSTIIFITVLFSSFAEPKLNHNINTYIDTPKLPSYINAKDFKGISVTSTSGLLKFTSGLDNDYYLVDSASRRGNLYIETRIDKFINNAAKKTSLNLSIVIDRSGSMSGEKKMDSAKKVAKEIIDRLTPNDFVSIVIYDEYIDVLQTAVPVIHKDSIKAKISKIMPRGSTNLWGGTEKGYEQVKSNYRKNYVNRVLLISDGLANAGIRNPDTIKAFVRKFKDVDGITISTFGAGLDYNEILMTEIAETGGGNYYFIDKPDKMEAMFDKELNGLMNAVAQNAELHITLPKGITIEKAYPFKYEMQGQDLVVKYRDLFSQELKGMVIQFKVASGTTGELKFLSSLQYTDVADGKAKVLTNTNTSNLAKNNEAYLTYFNKPVVGQVILYTANENMEKAMVEADKGNYNKAKEYTTTNFKLLTALGDSAKQTKEIQQMRKVTRKYDMALQRVSYLSADSIKLIQKSSRADNYNVRYKKN